MSRRLHALLITAALIVGTWMVAPADAQSRFWVLVNGALRYNGAVQVGNGSAAAPSYSFTGVPTEGFYSRSASYIGLTIGAIERYGFNTAGLTLQAAGALGWSSNTDPGTGPDTSITRVAAGEFGWTAVLFANLGTPANGTFCYCSDCTIAAPCASGGSGAFAKRLNGAWVCN
jgi:hypothetical protein